MNGPPALQCETGVDGVHDSFTVYARLMTHARGDSNDDPIARIYASWSRGRSVLPTGLGLSEAAYSELMAFHFPGYEALSPVRSTSLTQAGRAAEVADLVDLMETHRSHASPSESYVASMIASACLGSDHLWSDLGLWSRKDLSGLLKRNFRALADKNEHNMKWKRFLYKQLCETDSVYACRVPSCEYCAEYPRCFNLDEDVD